MRSARIAIAVAATLAAGSARADPIPQAMAGTWTDQPACGNGVRKMLFSGNTLTVVQQDGRRLSVQVATSGTLDTRLQVRVTKLLSGAASDPAGAHVGDVIVVHRDNDVLRLIGHADAGAPLQDDPNGPILHRCRS